MGLFCNLIWREHIKMLSMQNALLMQKKKKSTSCFSVTSHVSSRGQLKLNNSRPPNFVINRRDIGVQMKVMQAQMLLHGSKTRMV